MDEKYQTFITIPSTSRSTESDNQFRESIIKIASGNRYEIPQFIMAQEKTFYGNAAVSCVKATKNMI